MTGSNVVFFFFQAEDGIRDGHVTGVQTCALPIYGARTSFEASTSIGASEATAAGEKLRPSGPAVVARSEERRVGKECRSRWGPDQGKKKNDLLEAGRRIVDVQYLIVEVVIMR